MLSGAGLLDPGSLPGGTDDTGGVEQGGGHDLRVQLKQRQELLVLLRHSPADDEQIRGEEHFDVGVVALQSFGPFLP